MESTLTTVYVGDDGRVALIDPGWDTGDNRARLTHFLSSVGRRIHDVHLVVASHLHIDHLGLASWLHEEAGVQLALHLREADALLAPRDTVPDVQRFDAWGVPTAERSDITSAVRSTFPALDGGAGVIVDDGTELDAAGTPLRVLHTPGHTQGSICLIDDRNELLHTGDHVLPIVRPGLALGGDVHPDPIGDYLRSLDRLAPYDKYEVLPGHEFRFTGLRERRAELAAHHLQRSTEIASLLDQLSSPTVWDIAERVTWTGGWSSVTGFLRRSALAQTEMHVRYLGRESELSRPT